jgi:hypothetical protein
MWDFQQAQPTGSFFKPAEADGHLILITRVAKFEKRFDQMRGEEIDQAIVDLVDIDGDKKLREGVLLTHKGLTNRLSTSARMVLGRIGQVDTKSGNKAWVLLPFVAGDEIKAADWATANMQTPTAPAAGDQVAAAQALLNQLGVQVKQ